MNDRELLELAAKAAGRKYNVSRDTPSGWLLATSREAPDGDVVEINIWRPLTDDGDAMGLAVKLGMFATPQGLSEFQAFYSDEIARDNKPTSATRRAIVTISAYHGKAMTDQLLADQPLSGK